MSESKKRTNSNVSAAATKKPKPGFTLANVMNEIDKTTEELEAGSKYLFPHLKIHMLILLQNSQAGCEQTTSNC